MSTIEQQRHDEDVEEFWAWNWQDDWCRQMDEFGYVVFEEDEDSYTGTDRLNRICEMRWERIESRDHVPSPLWDAATPSRGSYRMTAQQRVFCQRLAAGEIEIEPDYADPDDDEWIAYEDE